MVDRIHRRLYLDAAKADVDLPFFFLDMLVLFRKRLELVLRGLREANRVQRLVIRQWI